MSDDAHGAAAGGLSTGRVAIAAVSCRVDAWDPARWYPPAQPDLRHALTECPDPRGEAISFAVPNPAARDFFDDWIDRTGPEADRVKPAFAGMRMIATRR